MDFCFESTEKKRIFAVPKPMKKTNKMKRIALMTLILASVATTSVFAQSNIYVASPAGSAINTYKTALKNAFSDVLGGFTEFNLVGVNASVDSLLQVMIIDRTNRKVAASYRTALANLTGIDNICYTIIDERNGRIHVESMLINCSTGNITRMLSQSIIRDVEAIKTVAQKMSKQLLY